MIETKMQWYLIMKWKNTQCDAYVLGEGVEKTYIGEINPEILPEDLKVQLVFFGDLVIDVIFSQATP